MWTEKSAQSVLRVAVVLLVGILCCPIVATGELLMVNVDVVGGESGTAWGGLNQAAWTIDWDLVYANPEETYIFDLPFSPMIAENNNQLNYLAIVHSLHVAIKADPVIEIGFDVESLAYDTQFTISIGAPLTFEAISGPTMQASAEIELLEADAQTTLTGGYDNSKAYRSYYDGNTFADLIGPVVGKGSTANETSGLQQMPGSVSSIYGQWQFTLSGNGRASGISSYTAAPAPEPATLSLLCLGSLALLRKKYR